MKTYLVIYFGAALTAILVTPIISRIARARGLMDSPGVRKVHQSPIPRVGGLAILMGVFALTLPVLLVDNTIGEAFRKIQPQVIVLLSAGALMCVLGLVDDVRGLRARTKLLVQLVAAGTVCAFGVRIEEIGVFSGLTLDLGLLSWPVTIIWIIGITNAVNLIDGLDGLATGISAAACAMILAVAIWSGQAVMAVLMLAMFGALSGFLFFNFNPAKVFLGDGGTYFVGFMIATASVMCSQKTSALIGLAMPLLALGVPVFDMVFVVIRRVLERRSIMAADRGHIHHRLLEAGLNQRHAVLFLYSVTLLAAGIGACMLVAREQTAFFLCLGLAMLVAVFRAVGAVRLRDSIKKMHRNMAFARTAKEEKHSFEGIQLRMQEAESFDSWWKAACDMAGQMDFERLTVTLGNGGNGSNASVWQRTSSAGISPFDVIDITIPINHGNTDPDAKIEVAARVNGSLEAVGRRVALFGRLIDESYPRRVFETRLDPEPSSGLRSGDSAATSG